MCYIHKEGIRRKYTKIVVYCWVMGPSLDFFAFFNDQKKRTLKMLRTYVTQILNEREEAKNEDLAAKLTVPSPRPQSFYPGPELAVLHALENCL